MGDVLDNFHPDAERNLVWLEKTAENVTKSTTNRSLSPVYK